MSFSWRQARPDYDPVAPYQDEPEASFKAAFSINGFDIQTGRGSSADTIAPQTSLVFDPASGQDAVGGSDYWFMAAHDIGPIKADFFTEANDGRDAYGVGFSKGGRSWDIRAEFANETDTRTTLGGHLQSRFNAVNDGYSASTVQLEAQRKLFGDWKLRGSVETASARLDGVEADGIWTSAWSLGLDAPVRGRSQWSLILSQPRRAEDGAYAFIAPIAVNEAGQLVFAERVASLTPSGRELDLEAQWRMNLNAVTRLDTSAALVSQAGHSQSSDLQGVVWISLGTSW